MKIWPSMEQRSEAWFRARAGRLTASNFHRVLTPSGKDSSQWRELAIAAASVLMKYSGKETATRTAGKNWNRKRGKNSAESWGWKWNRWDLSSKTMNWWAAPLTA